MRAGTIIRWAALLIGGFSVGQGADLASDDHLQFALIVTRHGVRPPLETNAAMAKYAAEPWPEWGVPPGHLTAHGARLMELMGAYYRARYVRAGLLTGRTEQDRAQLYFRTDSDQRTQASALRLAAGLLPGGPPVIHARPTGTPDPLFSPAKLPLGHPDRALAAAAGLGRIGADPEALIAAHAAAYATLQHVLFGDAPVPAGKRSLFGRPVTVVPGPSRDGSVLVLSDPLHQAMVLTEDFILEYAEGMPLAQVGWGRVNRKTLTQLLELHSLYFDLTQRTLYPAQVQASNLGQHICHTLVQAATGRAVPGAIGDPGQRVVVVVGHDTNLQNLSGLFGLSWILPGTQAQPVLPGSALVFELWRRGADGAGEVRVHYVSQTLDQMRNGEVLTLEHPPAEAPIFIPGCSTAGPGYGAPLARFEALVRRVVDPDFVAPGAD